MDSKSFLCSNFYWLFLLICFSGCNLSEWNSKKAYNERPNIIFLLTDDHRADALGYAGNPIIQTPQLDQLAREGIYFKNAYVTTSICAVSRASYLSGQYARRHGIQNFSTSFTKEAFGGVEIPTPFTGADAYFERFPDFFKMNNEGRAR